MPSAEILTIGTEILLGQIVDTNAAYLAQQLAAAGLNLFRKTSVGDNPQRIEQAIRGALEQADVVITTGGLGPTVDDMTRDAVARATDRPLVLREDLLQEISRFFERRGRPMSDNNRRQAEVPQGATAIHNPVGTAPGFIVPTESGYVISLPGVPRELRQLMQSDVLPFLRETFPAMTTIRSRILRVAAMSESEIDRKIADLETSSNPTVGLAAHAGQVDIRITASAETEAQTTALLDEMAAQVEARLPGRIYGTDAETLEGVLAGMLNEAGKTLAILETGTGGIVASRLPVYDARVLPTSRAREMAQDAPALAEQLRQQTGADIALVLLGDDDPALGPYAEQPGQTVLAITDGTRARSREVPLGGVSEVARSWLACGALEFLRRFLLAAE